MDAAIAAARRGHQVTLFEKQNRLGGQLQHSDYLPGKWNLKALKDYLIRELSLSGVEIRLGTEATPELLENYDAVVAAPGSVGKRLDVPGGDQDSFGSPRMCLETPISWERMLSSAAAAPSEWMWRCIWRPAVTVLPC